MQVSTVGFSRAQSDAFAAAEVFWEDTITGYAPGITQTAVNFTARKRGLDGKGGILGEAGPTDSVSQGGFVTSTGGTMAIDSADIDLLTSDGQLADVVIHEIGHILGIGSLWTDNGVYVNNSGRYTGSFGLQAYQPVEKCHQGANQARIGNLAKLRASSSWLAQRLQLGRLLAVV